MNRRITRSRSAVSPDAMINERLPEGASRDEYQQYIANAKMNESFDAFIRRTNSVVVLAAPMADDEFFPPSPELGDDFPYFLAPPAPDAVVHAEEEAVQEPSPLIAADERKGKRRRRVLIGMPKRKRGGKEEHRAKHEPEDPPGARIRASRQRRQVDLTNANINPLNPANNLNEIVRDPARIDPLDYAPDQIPTAADQKPARRLDVKLSRWWIPPMYQHLQVMKEDPGLERLKTLRKNPSISF